MVDLALHLGALLAKAKSYFDWGSSTQQDLYQLLQAYVGYTHAQCIAHEQDIVDEALVQAFWQACERCQHGEPLAYVIGNQPFMSLSLQVTPAVLIPRSDTEVLVETVLQQLPNTPKTILDLGTGSGAIALALAKARPCWSCVGMDGSFAALKVAKMNREQLDLPLPLFQGCWTEAVASHSVDVIVANPPYLGDTDPHLSQKTLQAEPREALIAAQAGLQAFIDIVADAKRVLRSQAYLFFEHGWRQHRVVADLLRSAGFQTVNLAYDYAGHPRVTWASGLLV